MGTVANMEIKKGINKPNVHSLFLNENSIFGNILFTNYISNKVFYKNKKLNIVLPKIIII